MKIKQILALLTAMFCVMLEPMSASALSAEVIPAPQPQEMTLTIDFFVEKTGVKTPISGASMAIYPIADMSYRNGSVIYTVSEPYQTLQKTKNGRDVTFDGLSVSETVALAEQFAALAKEPAASAVTDEQGKCTFTLDQQGMYLIREIAASGDAGNYELIAPYMISAPYPDTLSEPMTWQYDILSEPKTKIVEKVVSVPELSENSPPPDPPESSLPSEGSLPDQSSDASESSETTSVPVQESSKDTPSILTGEGSGFLVAGITVFASALLILLIPRKKHPDDNA